MTDSELLQAIYSDMQELKQRVTGIEITLENETNKNIKLLAENHGNLIDKLNQAIKVSDKTAIYEIQVNIILYAISIKIYVSYYFIVHFSSD